MEKEWDRVWKRKGFLTKLVDFGREKYNNYFIRVLEKKCNKNSKVLEVGCGTASLTLMLCDRIKKLIGIDISKKALEIAEQNAKNLNVSNAEFIKMDCTKMTFPSKTFDLVWSQGLIEHFKDPLKIVEEKIRVCKKGGHVLISVPYLYSYMHVWYLATRPKLFRNLWPWTEQEFYTKQKFTRLIKRVNLDNLDYKIFLLRPVILGIIIMEITKNQ